MVHLGAKVKEELSKVIEDGLAPWLEDGEAVAAIFRANRLRPLTEAIVITNHRLLSVGSFLKFFGEIAGNDVKSVILKGSFAPKLIIANPDGTEYFVATVRKSDAKDVARFLEKMSGSPKPLDFGKINEQNRVRMAQEAAARNPRIAHRLADLPEEDKQRYAREQAKKEQHRNEVVKQFKQEAATRAEAEPTHKFKNLIIGHVNKASLQEVISSCRDGELPEFIAGEVGGGVLAAFSDRCVVIKKGLGTSLLAGSLGGGRTVTIHYSDITGIEYNAGLANGTLEILTPSYQGTKAASVWAKRDSDNSAYALSNVLPWSRHFYKQVRPKIEWMQQQVQQAKSKPSSIASSSAADELTKLADLHKQGILSDKEFADAKTRLLAKV